MDAEGVMCHTMSTLSTVAAAGNAVDLINIAVNQG
jgi:hypothetical protein